MARRLGDDDSCVVGLGGVEEVLCERQGEVHASVRRWIAREIPGVQEYSGPCQSFRERHGGIIVFLGTMSRVFAQDAEDARSELDSPAGQCSPAFDRFGCHFDKRMPLGHQ
jgi:hypothetical protein